jgi:CMP-N,N'-diacetyllegionaminic acid synthase
MSEKKARKNTRVLAIIPARGGSKRVPRKNIRELNGIPLIIYTIRVALETDRIDRVIVSTDDKEIASVASAHGAEVPFLRPYELSNDNALDYSVLKHSLEWLEVNENYIPDIVLHLRPTSPFKTSRLLDAVLDKMRETGANLVRTMTKTNGASHPYWMYKLDEYGMATPFIEDVKVSSFYQSQLLPVVFRLNGVVDAIKPSILKNEDRYKDEQPMAIVEVPEVQSFDIDTELDFIMCELLIKYASNQLAL